MPRDFLSLVGRSGDLLKALRRIALGGVIATTGVAAAPTVATATTSPDVAPVTPSVVDRVRKGAKLILQLPDTTVALSAEHRSHRSHSSHRSHFSSSGGGGTAAPAPAAPVTPAPSRPVAAAPLDLTKTTPANAVRGEIVAIDTNARTITIKENATTRATFAYRDDSKFQAAVGIGVRWDDFASANGNRLPVAAGDKVQLTWRTSTDGQLRILNSIQKTP